MGGPSDKNERRQEPASARARSQWYYSRDRRVLGPFTSAQLRELATAGQLLRTDLVQRAGSAQWAPASSVKRLFPEADHSGRVQAQAGTPSVPNSTTSSPMVPGREEARSPTPQPKDCAASMASSPLETPGVSRLQALAEAVVVPDASRCVQCGCCTFNCPIGIDVRAHAWRGVPIEDSHCLTCSECVRRCPRGVLEFDVLAVFRK